jgi:23S rRNA (guanosine2251-2'-O)-methyltransferase
LVFFDSRAGLIKRSARFFVEPNKVFVSQFWDMKPRFNPPHGAPNKQARENRHVQTVETSVPSLDEDDVLAIVAQQAVPFVLILDCVQDPHNLGAILRTADAAGVHVVVAPKDKAVGITETVRRVSVGAANHVPFAQVTNLARTMEKLKAAGLWLVDLEHERPRLHQLHTTNGPR